MLWQNFKDGAFDMTALLVFGGTLLLKNLISSNLFTVCISSSILKISPLVGEECRDQFLLGIAEEFAEFAAEGFRVGSFESMFASDILLDSF